MSTNEPTVLVTRPAAQATHLCAQLKAQGFWPICFPTIEIQTINDDSHAINALRRLHHYDYLIFVSSNAVLEADKLAQHTWPESKAAIVSIGPKTAKTLTHIKLTPAIIATAPFNTEQLLLQFKTPLKSSRCLIVKGEGGRTLLNEQLSARGMQVDTIDVYRRVKPTQAGNSLDTPPNFITVTSQLALKHLFELLPQHANALKQHSTFVAFSPRIAEYAKQQHCQKIIICKEASDASLLTSIINSKNDNRF